MSKGILAMLVSFKTAGYYSCLMILGFLLAGCATWTGHGLTAYDQQRLKIAVLPVQSDFEITRLKDIETVPEAMKGISGEQERVKQEIQRVTEEMTHAIEARLSATPVFEVIPHDKVAEALASQSCRPANVPLSVDQIKDIGKILDAQAVLQVRLSSYGRLKRKWVAYLIGTGVAEGVTEGVIAGGAIGNVWAGLVVAVEEIGQEVLTWGGGSYLFNMYYAPVTLEGELISTSDGAEVWSHTTFDSIDRKALKKLPEEEQKRKEVQLTVTAEKAEKDLVEDLEKAAKKNLSP